MLRVLQLERGLGAMQRLRALGRRALRPAALTILCGICISGIVMGIVSYGVSGLLRLF